MTRRRARCPRSSDARAEPRPLPGRGGLHRARRRARLLGVLRPGRADDPLPADLDARALARLEGADPVLRPPLPRRLLRPARQRPLRPAARSRRPTTRREFAQDAIDVMDACGVDRAMCVALSTRRAARRCCSPPSTPSAWPGWSSSARGSRSAGCARCAGGCCAHPRVLPLAHEATADDARLGQVQPALLDARRLRRLRPVVGGEDAARAALDQADRGRDRVVARHRRRDARRSASWASWRRPPTRRDQIALARARRSARCS